MCRIKFFLVLAAGIFAFSGCGLMNNLVTDTGSGASQGIAREEYLMQPAEGEKQHTSLKVLTLEKGTFEEDALRQTLNRTLSLSDIPSIRVELKEEKMRFGGYSVDYLALVEKGDVIAKIFVEKDAIALEEARTNLTRLKERMAEAEKEASKELSDMEEKRPYIYDSYDGQIADIRYRQRELDWENEKYRYSNQIAEATKHLNELQQVGEIYEVKADREGYVFYSTRYAEGYTLHRGDYICHIIDPDKIYMYTDNQADQMPFGKQVEFDSRLGQMAGEVVNGGGLALYGNLDTNKAVFRVYPGEGTNRINLANLNSVTMNAKLKKIENVILVPKDAVTVEEDYYYVTVQREDGSLLRTRFLPGGSNVSQYWVLEGLTEGMQIVY